MVEALEVTRQVIQPATLPTDQQLKDSKMGLLVMRDGSIYKGISFGAETSVAGECVFQTGMVGYTESLTDPSYSGQILILTFPLIGNYGVPSEQEVSQQLNQLPLYFESSKIHISALIVGKYSDDYSHFLAKTSLSDWLKKNNVPALYGLDTRALTKKIRSGGVLLGKVLMLKTEKPLTDLLTISGGKELLTHFDDLPFHDPNSRNLVAEVSTKKVLEFKADPKKALKAKIGKTIKILAVDVGMKYNQIRCFVNRGVDLKVVPWDYDFVSDQEYDGLFISNGPGDPKICTKVIEKLRKLIENPKKPIFGICLGHQLLALAAGAETKKMKFGNRGHNIPCTDLITGKCHITSQNHGYAVDAATLPKGWKELFINANDGSNEGIQHETLPIFSVQFHPESTPGPRDTEFLFDRFIQQVQRVVEKGKLVNYDQNVEKCQPQRVQVSKVLILGSGGLSIGQAGEFDYSGSQAIKALKEEGIYTVLINPNIATIQTSKGLADKVYFLPVTPEFVRKVIEYERPDGIYVSFGGQTALNCGVKMKDEFEQLGVKVLGTPIDTVIVTEDRELFAKKMAEINEKCAESSSATNIKEATEAAKRIGYPVIARAAYALGGLGSGFATNEKELIELCHKAFAFSPQVLIERSMKGWKEIEYEVVRDVNDNCITVCNMENFDPLGIHTGDSIVVAPSQTLSDEDYNMLRTTAVNVIRHLGVVGECNIQYALNPFSKEYCIIEVNARLSRSSALASKATGYPLAFVAAKLGLGIPLSDLKNNVTKVTCACFEPSLDYVVVKIPRWDLKKFNRVSTKVGSAMKSVGEVMSIGRNFEEAIQKAIRAIDYSFLGFVQKDFGGDLEEELQYPSDQRLFAICKALHQQYSVQRIWELTKIDPWFLNKLKNIVDLDQSLSKYQIQQLPVWMLKQAKQLGFSDRHLAKLLGSTEMLIRKLRQEAQITPFVKQIDTVAAEFPSYTNYLYMTYNASEHDVEFNEQGVLVLGSGVYRIGSSVEFDWCAVRTVRTLRQNGYKTIMMNYNPETVSTDYDEADRLYFENIHLETVMDVYELEQSSGVIVSMGGQTPNNIALPLYREGVKIYGTSPEQIDSAENRYKFSRMCDSIQVNQPRWKELSDIQEAHLFCEQVGYPVLVRPSYVLSGAAMNVVYSKEDLEQYLHQAVSVSPEYPVVISKFIEEAKEIEMDAVAEDGKLLYWVVSEHVENAGVHSGDATLILPPQDLDKDTVKKIEMATRKIGNALNVTGPFNIQFIAKRGEILVIECNLRASRSFPLCSKVMGLDMIELSTKVMMGMDYHSLLLQHKPSSSNGVCVKVPQFSFGRLNGADPVCGVEMASTGEVACFGQDHYEAYLKALLSTGFILPKKNILLSVGGYKEKLEILGSIEKLVGLGFCLFATEGTADFLGEHGIQCRILDHHQLNNSDNNKDQEYDNSLSQYLRNHLIDLYINLPSRNRYRRPASFMSNGYLTRRMAVDLSVPLITNVKCFKLFVEAIWRQRVGLSAVGVGGVGQVGGGTVGVVGSQVEGAVVGSEAVEGGTSVLQRVVEGVGAVDYQTSCLVKGFRGFINCHLPLELLSSNTIHSGYTCHVLVGTTPNTIGSTTNTAAVEKGYNDYIILNQEDLIKYIPPKYDLSTIQNNMSNYSQSGVQLIYTEAKGVELLSILYYAQLLGLGVHVSQVRGRAELEVIGMSKRRGVRVSCDVCIHSMFISKSMISEGSSEGSSEIGEDVKGEVMELVMTDEEVEFFWENLEYIDCFSVGRLPFLLYQNKDQSTTTPHTNSTQSMSAVEECIPLLLTAVRKGLLSQEEMEDRVYWNPIKIFGLSFSREFLVEYELDRAFTGTIVGGSAVGGSTAGGSAGGSTIVEGVEGKLSRVCVDGQTIYLDGRLIEGIALTGKQLHSQLSRVSSTAVTTSATAVPPVTTTSTTSTATVQPEKRHTRVRTISESTEKTFVSQQQQQHKPVDQSDTALLTHSHHQEIPADLPRSVKANFYRHHILSVKHFSRHELHILFSYTQEMRTLVERNQTSTLLQGKVMSCLFYEASTRTRCSFESAMLRLGGQVINIQPETSSIQKGESLKDTVRTLGQYSDLIVLRHPEPNSIREVSKFSKIPIINAGDGVGEHPTQAFLDIYTIREELGSVNGLRVLFLGDLKHGRTVHSLVRVLLNYDVRLWFVSPKGLEVPSDLLKELDQLQMKYEQYTELTPELIQQCDVLYITRIQKERFPSEQEYLKVKDQYHVDNSVLLNAKRNCIVMHPLPRCGELHEEVDLDQRAVYFRQMRYGMYLRMALLGLVLGK